MPALSPPAATDVHVPLRWSDMDAFGHVNNVQFLRLLEDARIAALPRWFPDGWASLEQGVVVTRHEIEFRRPLDYRPEPVAVHIWITQVGGSSFGIGYVMTDPPGVGAGADATYVVAETGMACYDFSSAAPRQLTEPERAALRAHLGPPAPLRRRGGEPGQPTGVGRHGWSA